MDSPIIINRMNPLSFLGVLGVIFIFLSPFSMKFLWANRIAPDGTPHSAASHLGLFCLPLSHKKDARLINDLTAKHKSGELRCPATALITCATVWFLYHT